MTSFDHVPVLLSPTLAALSPQPGEIFVDLTLGGAGHARRILEAVGPTGLLIAFDRDPIAVEAASARLDAVGNPFEVVPSPFATMRKTLEAHARVRERGGVDGILVDLGVSSPQIDTPERGFSYRWRAPLDMRMGPDAPTVAEWLDRVDEGELARALRVYGEVPMPGRHARAILEARRAGTLETTSDLVAVVTSVAGRKGPRSHPPSTLVFQALRIAVNDELGQLERLLADVPHVLRVGGRFAGISFHSLEDRPLKHTLDGWTRSSLPAGLPVQGDAPDAPFRWIARSVTADAAELAENPRARSARLRAVVRVAEGLPTGSR